MKKHNISIDSPPSSVRSVDVAALSRKLAALPAVPPTARPRTQQDLIEQLREPLIEALVDRPLLIRGLGRGLGVSGASISAPIPCAAISVRSTPTGGLATEGPPADQPPVGEPSPHRWHGTPRRTHHRAGMARRAGAAGHRLEAALGPPVHRCRAIRRVSGPPIRQRRARYLHPTARTAHRLVQTVFPNSKEHAR